MMSTINTSAAPGHRIRGKYSPIGIDFGSGRVKMLQLKQQRGNFHVHDKCHFPMPLETTPNSLIASTADPHLLLEQLRQAKHNCNWRGNRACLSMDSRACYTRAISLPPLRTRELKEAVRWEVRKNFPFEIDNAVVSWAVLGNGSGPEQPGRRYLIASVQKTTADFYTAVAQKAGFKPVSLEIPLTALLRSVKLRPKGPDPDASKYQLLVDCGFSSTLVLLTVKGTYCFHRVLNLGAGHFYRAATGGKKGDLKAALRLVHSRASLAEKGLMVEASRLARAISETLAYWSSLSHNDPVNPAVMEVSGGGILIPGLASYLYKELGLKPRLYNPVHLINSVRVENGTGSGNGFRETLYTTAHGLTLRGWLK